MINFNYWKILFTDRVSVNKKYLTDSVSVNKKFLTDSGVPIETKNTWFIIGFGSTALSFCF